MVPFHSLGVAPPGPLCREGWHVPTLYRRRDLFRFRDRLGWNGSRSLPGFFDRADEWQRCRPTRSTEFPLRPRTLTHFASGLGGGGILPLSFAVADIDSSGPNPRTTAEERV
jgi:hypothetical protein